MGRILGWYHQLKQIWDCLGMPTIPEYPQTQWTRLSVISVSRVCDPCPASIGKAEESTSMALAPLYPLLQLIHRPVGGHNAAWHYSWREAERTWVTHPGCTISRAKPGLESKAPTIFTALPAFCVIDMVRCSRNKNLCPPPK